jgi:glycosyltransferase involved in cell wall biosynthesis
VRFNAPSAAKISSPRSDPTSNSSSATAGGLGAGFTSAALGGEGTETSGACAGTVTVAALPPQALPTAHATQIHRFVPHSTRIPVMPRRIPRHRARGSANVARHAFPRPCNEVSGLTERVVRRVALVIKNLDVGGAEQQVIALALGLARHGWQPLLVTLDAASSADVLAPLLTEQAIPWHTAGLQPGVRGFGSLGVRVARRLARVIAEAGVEIVHGHMVHANLLSRLACASLPAVRVINTVHNEHEAPPGSLKLWLEDRLYAWTEPLNDFTTCVCQRGVERHLAARASSPGRIAYLANGIDVSRWSRLPGRKERLCAELRLPHDAWLWLSVMRLRPEKDPANLLRAFGLHAARRPLAQLVIAGDGPMESRARAFAHTLGIESRVHFLGRRRDVVELMSAADGFVMSSEREGMPMVLLEAALCGLPVAATDVGNTAELVPPDVGRVVPSHDADALAAAMTLVLDDPRLRTRALQRATEVAAEFDIDRVVRRWIQLYERVLSSPPRGWSRRLAAAIPK